MTVVAAVAAPSAVRDSGGGGDTPDGMLLNAPSKRPPLDPAQDPLPSGKEQQKTSDASRSTMLLPSPPSSAAPTPSSTTSSSVSSSTSAPPDSAAATKLALRQHQSLGVGATATAKAPTTQSATMLHELRRSSFTMGGIPLEFGPGTGEIGAVAGATSEETETPASQQSAGNSHNNSSGGNNNDASFDLGSVKEDDDVILGGSSSAASAESVDVLGDPHHGHGHGNHRCVGPTMGGHSLNPFQPAQQQLPHHHQQLSPMAAAMVAAVNANSHHLHGGGGGVPPGNTLGGYHHRPMAMVGGGPNIAPTQTLSPTAAGSTNGTAAAALMAPHPAALMVHHQQQFIPMLPPQVGIPPPPLPPPHMLPPGAAGGAPLPTAPPLYMPPPMGPPGLGPPGTLPGIAMKPAGAQSPPQHWTNTPPPALIQPPANCQLRQQPFYTLTCEAAAVAAAQIAAAGYHVTAVPNANAPSVLTTGGVLPGPVTADTNPVPPPPATTNTSSAVGAPGASTTATPTTAASASGDGEQQQQHEAVSGGTSGGAHDQQQQNGGIPGQLNGGGGGSGGSNFGSSGLQPQQQLGVGGNNLQLPPALMAAINGGHDLFVHIHPGDSISLAVGNEIQTVQGPATIRMVSQTGPTQAIPLNVPQGHVVQQLLDRQGFLSHIIMTQEVAAAAAGGAPAGMSPNMFAAAAAAGGGGGTRSGAGTPARGLEEHHQNHQQHQPHQGRWSQRRQHQASGGGAAYATDFHHHNGGAGLMPQPPPLSSIVPGVEMETMLHQAAMLVPGMQHQQQPGFVAGGYHPHILGHHHPNQLIAAGGKPQAHYDENLVEDPVVGGIVPSADEQDEQGEKERLREMLNSVQKPSVVHIGAHEVNIVWQELDTSEAGASGGPFPHIDASEFQYELHLFECSGQQSPKCLMLQRCPTGSVNQNSNNAFRITALRPGNDYEIRIRASLPERELFGHLSTPVGFRTHPSKPDPPPMPKMVMRQATTLHVQWRAPTNNGAPIHTYCLQIARGKQEMFSSVYEGPKEEARITRLEPGAFYRVRVLARNDYGASDFSPQLVIYPYEPHHQQQNRHHSQGQQQHGGHHQTSASSPSPSLSSSTTGGGGAGSFYSAGAAGRPQLQQQHQQQQQHQFQQQQKSPSGILLASPTTLTTASPISPGGMSQPPPLPVPLLLPQHQTKPSPPTVHSVASRFVRLSWSVPLGVDAALLTLEMCDVRGGGPRSAAGVFEPVPPECYSASGSFANVQGLNPGREYRFRLSFNGGDLMGPIHSEFVSVRTHKDHRGVDQQQSGGGQFSGNNYQQQQQQTGNTGTGGGGGGPPYILAQHPPLQTPQQLQRLFECAESVEIGWKYPDTLANHVSFVVEASSAAANLLPTNAEDGALLPGSCLPALQEPWRVCYRGQATNCTVHDARLCLFRVQTVSTRPAFGQSQWTDVLFVKRQSAQQQQIVVMNRKHSTQQQQQQQTGSGTAPQQPITIQQRHSGTTKQQPQQKAGGTTTSTPEKTTEKQQQQPTEVVTAPQKPSQCSAPRLQPLSPNSLKINWRMNGAGGTQGGNGGSPKKQQQVTAPSLPAGTSLLFELQRVDKQPPTIVYSGNETEFELMGLKPAEHIQTRVRAVHLDLEGRRLEGDWSGVGSACTKCDVPSPPRNVRIIQQQDATAGKKTVNESSASSTAVSITLEWDPPAQLNGASVNEYVVHAERLNATSEGSAGTVAEKVELGYLPGSDACRFTAATLMPAQFYRFSVVAVNEAGPSQPSDPLEPYRTPAAVPEPPASLGVKPLSTTELHIEWQAPTADNGAPVTAFHFDVFKVVSNGGGKELVSQMIIPAQQERELVVQTLEAETDYEVTIQAANSIGKSAKVVQRASTFAQPPEPPKIQLVQAQANQLKLKWGSPAPSSTSASPLYYYLEKENENGTFSPVYEGELHTAKVRGLREQTNYWFRIRASNGKSGLTGPWSQKQAFSTTRQPPPSLKQAPVVTELTPGELYQMEWTPVRCPSSTSTSSAQIQQQQQQQNDSEEVADHQPQLASSQQQQQFVYRLEVAPKLAAGREKTTEVWKVYYEGNSTMCTLSPSGAFTKQARVLVVQQWLDDKGAVVEECVSAPSPVAVFPVQNAVGSSSTSSKLSSTSESPRKRSNVGKKGRGDAAQTVAAPRPNRTSLMKRVRKFGSWLRKVVAEKEYSALIILALLVISALFLAFVLNNYYL